MVQIYCKNTGTSKEFVEGTPLYEMVDAFDFEKPYPIISAKVNNVSQGLKYRAYQNRDVEFIDARAASGRRVYIRSLCFLLCKAVRDVIPGARTYLEHPISNGYYVNIRRATKELLTDDEIARIKECMNEAVGNNLQFHRCEAQTSAVVKLFQERGMEDKVKLLRTSEEVYTTYYTLGDAADYYYGCLVPSAGYLKVWDICRYHEGILLRLPDFNHPDQLVPMIDQPKTFDVFSEYLRWNIIMGLSNVGDVNEALINGQATDLIQIAEALQEKKIVQIAEEIERRVRQENNPLKVVLITGPSSSGKTTFCKRLSVQLKACGLKPISFSTDDYFVNRVETPLLPDGKYDFDNFETVDHKMLERDVNRLIAGERVEIPEYNFTTGLREYNGKTLKLTKGSVLLIEGIHALNPKLIPSVPSENTFRIFINTMTCTSLDNHNSIPTNDNRLLRRIIRDYKKGAFTAVETISQWPSVCEAEKRWILPYQESADVMFNSAYLIEFAVLRSQAERILATVPKNCPEYSEAHRLQKFIHYFHTVPDKDIPKTSLLREFIGGGNN